MNRRFALLLAVLATVAGAALWHNRDRIWPSCSSRERPAWLTDPAPLVVFGDSHVCQARFGEEYPRVDFAWRGLPGATTAQLDERVGQALAPRPRKVLLVAGTNDVVQGRTPEQFRADYGQLVARFPQGPALALTTMPPCSNRLCNHPVQQQRLLAMNAEISRIAAERGATLIDLHAAIAGPDGSLPPDLTTDGIHLSAEANRRFHTLVAPWMEGETGS
ncbi:GDSL-type esterase/lipase family protein [Tsuneonella sp. HG222]